MKRTITLSLPLLQARSTSKKLVLVAIGVILLGGSVLNWNSVSTFILYRDDGEREVRRLLLDIGSKAVLPSDEIPGLATVADKTKINQGGVLARAKNGDKVLLFYSAGQAIVYRPSTHKVVAIGPLIVDASAAQVKDTRIVVKNGSGDDAKYQQILTKVKSRYPTAKITAGGSAARSDYPKTIVIDVTTGSKKSEFIGAINELVDSQKGIVPSSEQAPADADILIIVGKD